MTQLFSGTRFLTQTVVDLLDGLESYAPQTVILFGSTARGDTHELSDIDLIIIKETERTFGERRRDAEAFLPKGLEPEIDAFVYTPAEFAQMTKIGNPFIGEALLDGIVLYDNTIRLPLIRSAWEWAKNAGVPFMFNPQRTARRWLAMADQNIVMGRVMLREGYFSDVCFKSHRAVEFALKAYLYLTGARFARGHSISELASQCATWDADFAPIVRSSDFMKDYYSHTQYVDTVNDPFPELTENLYLPSDMYSREQAEESLIFAVEIMALVRSKLPPENQ